MTFRNALLAAGVLLGAFLGAIPAQAHPGHDHDDSAEVVIGREQAQAASQKVLAAMVKKQIVEPSWLTVAPVSSDLRSGADGEQEWVTVYQNPAVADAAKQTLYVILTGSGDYLAANYSGR